MRKCTAILLLIALLLSLSACGMLAAPLLETIPTEQSSEPTETSSRQRPAAPTDAAGVLAAGAENMKAATGAAVRITMEVAAEGEEASISLSGEMLFAPFALRLEMQDEKIYFDFADTMDLYFRDAKDGAVLYYGTRRSNSVYSFSPFSERVPFQSADLGSSVGALFQALFELESPWEMEETDSAYVLRTEINLSETSSSLRIPTVPQLAKLGVGGLPAFPVGTELKFELTLEIDREQLLLRRVSLDFTELLSSVMGSMDMNIEKYVISMDFSDYNTIERIERPMFWTDRLISGLSFQMGKDTKADPDQLDEITLLLGENSNQIRLSALSANDLVQNGWVRGDMSSSMGEPTKMGFWPFLGMGAQTEESYATAILYSDAPVGSTEEERNSALSTRVFLSVARDLEEGRLDERISFESPLGIRSGMQAEEAIQILGEPSASFDEEIFTCYTWTDGKTALSLYFFPENGLFALSRSQITDMGALPFLRES